MAPADSTTESAEGRTASRLLREHAIAIWRAALAASDPKQLIRQALEDKSSPIVPALAVGRRVLVVGGGKAAGAMAAALEDCLPQFLDRMEGLVNVPADCVRPLRRIRLHGARPAGINEPTQDGVEGSLAMLDLLSRAARDDVAVCLLSGGGSALLPAPPPGVSIEDERKLTRMMHASGATIDEMNAVRKHLSRIKGGQLAQTFRGERLFGLLISDVIGDRLDVIASGATAPDPTTFGDALSVLERYGLLSNSPPSIVQHLRRGAAGQAPETPKDLPSHVQNYVIGNNRQALAEATVAAEKLGYRVLNLGSFVDGETRDVAATFAAIVRSAHHDGVPLSPPLCLLSGGETTVTLSDDHGLGGRNQEFVLALTAKLGHEGMSGVLVLSVGTDGEDGPCDAAGALADGQTLRNCRQQGIDPAGFLARHDSYHFFEAVGGLMKTGLTETNVMDVRVILVR
jgi:hydroxypyruvate reductase/glycerate 2-kinase